MDTLITKEDYRYILLFYGFENYSLIEEKGKIIIILSFSIFSIFKWISFYKLRTEINKKRNIGILVLFARFI